MREMLKRWSDTLKQRHVIEEFLEWLDERRIALDFARADPKEFRLFDDQKPRRLLDKFFEIDQAQLERERREYLEQLPG